MVDAAAALEGVPEAAPARGRRRLAALLGLAAVGEALAIMWIGSLGDPRFVMALELVPVGFIANVVVFPVMGALIVQRRPATRVAWLMIALGVGLGFGLLSYAYGIVGLPPRDLPLALPILVLSQLFFLPAIGGVTSWILLLYPTDRLPGPRWRWAGALAIIGPALYVFGTTFRPGPLDEVAAPGVVNPLAPAGELGDTLRLVADLGNGIGVVALILSVVSLVARYRRADRIVAAQIRWLALVAIIAVGSLGTSLLPFNGPLNDLLFGLGLTLIAGIPIAIGIAITRYRLYDIDRLINRALVYGSLTAILAGVFTAGVGLAQRMFVAVTHETSDAAVVGATLVVATLYAPLRKRLEGLVDRRFKFEQARFGAYREELLRAMTISDPRRAAARLAREAVVELELLGAAVVDRRGAVVASAGVWPAQPVVRVPIRHGGEILHVLALGPRRDGERSDPREVADLEALAELAAAAAAAASGGASGRS